MQYMHILYGLDNFVPEMEVKYYIEYKMVDYIMRSGGPLDAQKEGEEGEGEECDTDNIGVSVTRAVSFPLDTPYTMEKARELLGRKLYGLVVARDCVAEGNPFQRAILHIWCYSDEAAGMIRTAHGELVSRDSTLPPEQRTYDNVTVICTVCPQTFIYNNRRS